MKLSTSLAILAALLITSCATTGQYKTSDVIGPYTTFSGRLIIIEPTRRWQVAIDWDGTSEKGMVRLTHAMSNRIILLSWHHDTMLTLDNQNTSGHWKVITADDLTSQGIILPPQQLALILSGKIPETLIRKKTGEWEGYLDQTLLRVKWISYQHKLELTDITHGRKAILMIQP